MEKIMEFTTIRSVFGLVKCASIFFTCFFLWFFHALPQTALAGEPPSLILDPAASVQLIDGAVALLTDPNEEMTVEQALAAPAERFTLPDALTRGEFETATQWRLFSLHNPTDISINKLVEVQRPRLNYVDFYLVHGDGRLTHYEAGSRRPVSVRVYPHRSFVFPVAVAPGETIRVLLRTKTEGAVVVSIKAWNVTPFAEYSAGAAWYYGVMQGVALVLILFAGIAAFSFNDRAAFWLMIQIAGFHIRLLGLSGLIHQTFLPEHPALADMIGDFSTGLGLAGGFMFLVEFLHLRHKLPRLALLFQGLAALSVALTATAFIGLYGAAAAAVNAMVLVYAVLSISLLAYLALTGEKRLGLLGCGVAVQAAAIVLRIGKNFGLPVSAETAEWSPYVGFYAYAAILAVAAARHIRMIEDERLALAHQMLEETEKRETMLNRMVQERTAELEESRRLLLDNLERERQSRQEQRNFLSMVSHEFKTPMSIILASVSTMTEHVLDATETAEEMGNITAAVARMQGLVEKCLSDEWLDQACMVLDPAPVNLALLLSEVLAVQRVNHEDRPFILQKEGTPRALNGDHMLLRVLFANVIENAAKYSPAGAPVVVDVRWGEAEAVVSIIDHGAPISAEDRQHIFEKFYRSPRQRRKEGAGLGLYLVKRIARLHGGDIVLDDQPSAGNRFIVTLKD